MSTSCLFFQRLYLDTVVNNWDALLPALRRSLAVLLSLHPFLSPYSLLCFFSFAVPFSPCLKRSLTTGNLLLFLPPNLFTKSRYKLHAEFLPSIGWVSVWCDRIACTWSDDLQKRGWMTWGSPLQSRCWLGKGSWPCFIIEIIGDFSQVVKNLLQTVLKIVWKPFQIQSNYIFTLTDHEILSERWELKWKKKIWK